MTRAAPQLNPIQLALLAGGCEVIVVDAARDPSGFMHNHAWACFALGKPYALHAARIRLLPSDGGGTGAVRMLYQKPAAAPGVVGTLKGKHDAPCWQ